jgi:hypothetical protein
MFHFEFFWINMPGFLEVVQGAWNENFSHVELCQLLYHKLIRVAQRLRQWSMKLFPATKVHAHMALSVILRLDITQETRQLSLDEKDLRKGQKGKSFPLPWPTVLGRGKLHELSF